MLLPFSLFEYVFAACLLPKNALRLSPYGALGLFAPYDDAGDDVNPVPFVMSFTNSRLRSMSLMNLLGVSNSIFP